MAGFGGAVKLTGESEYRRALKQIQVNLKEVSSEMKAVSAQFDKNDDSTESLKAKTDALNKQLFIQKSALSTLETEYTKLSAEQVKNIAKHADLVNEYDKEKAKLEALGKEMGTDSAEYKEQAVLVTNLARDVDKSSQANEKNEQTLSGMRTEMNNLKASISGTESELKKADDSTDDLADSTKEAGDEAKKAGDGFTVFKGVLADLASSAIKSALTGLKNLGGALINVGKQALTSYADYEQLVGGVETLFEDSADVVNKYASVAYKTAGISANAYMETVTSFSASLLQGLGGDTAKASEYANKAIIDMSDNANKMGTDMSSIQNAYMGFAKGNYTMLDNLKLGYGGTKGEMARLVKESGILGEAGKDLTAKNFDEKVSFDQIIEAIHVTQERMGILGTTSKEASTTISGSINSMQGAWSNLLTGIADDNADFNSLISNFIDSVLTVADNILPRIKTIVSGLGKMVSGLVEKLVPELVKEIPPLISETVPILISAVKTTIEAVMNVLPDILSVISDLIPQILTLITELTPELADAGIQILTALITGFSTAIPQLLGMLPSMIKRLTDVIMKNLPLLISAGMELIKNLLSGIQQTLPQLLSYVPKIISQFCKFITQNLPSILQSGIEMLGEFINGILDAIPDLLDMLPVIIETVVNFVMTNLPVILGAGVRLMETIIKGLDKTIPQLIKFLPKIIETLINTLLTKLPQIIQMAMRFIVSIIDGLTKALPQLIRFLPQIILTIVNTLFKNLPTILKIGVEILEELIKGLGSVLGSLGKQVGVIVSTIVDGIKALPEKLLEVGKNAVKGIWTGITNMTQWLKDKIKGLGSIVTNALKSVLGIHSPSTVFRDEIGKNLALGLGEGFTEEMKNVTSEMQQAIPTSFDASVTSSGLPSGIASTGGYASQTLVDAFKTAMEGMKIEMGEDGFASFVVDTITAEIYQ